MIHKHNASDLFPSWYKSIDPVVTSEIVTNRIDAIEKFITNENTELWLDIVKLAYGMSDLDPNTISTLENEFKVEDINFPLVSNENLLQVLAQIMLCFLFESENLISEKIALAVTNVPFLSQFEKSKIPFFDYALELLSTPIDLDTSDTLDNRNALQAALDGMEEEPESEVLMDYTDQVALVKTVNLLYDNIIKIKQESNILWWLFGSFSSLSKSYFSELGLQKMILCSAFELADLNSSNTNLVSAKHLLHKALSISNRNSPILDKVSLKVVVVEADITVKETIKPLISNATLLTPCLFAVNLFFQFDDPNIWINALKTKMPGLDIETEYNPQELAFQIYNEITFLKSL